MSLRLSAGWFENSIAAVFRRSAMVFSCRSQLTVRAPSSADFGSAEEVMIFRIVRGTKLTMRPSSVPSWRATSKERGVWLVQRAAETHSVRR